MTIRKEDVVAGKPRTYVKAPSVSVEFGLLVDLEMQYTLTRKERAKLSSRTATIVEGLAKKFRKEAGASAEHDFLQGHIPVPELKEHYAKISAITDELTAIYDKIRSVKETGALPKIKRLVESVDNLDSADIKAIQYEIRRLDDSIHKTQKKMDQANGGIKAPKNSNRMLAWKEKIAMATTKRDALKIQLSQLRHGERAAAE